MSLGTQLGASVLVALSIASGALTLQPETAAAETVLRIAMTAGDVPDWAGQPDQGFEGYRFVGFNLYDGVVDWDLSRNDREADIRPALATKWFPDPGNPKKWIIELRHDVKLSTVSSAPKRRGLKCRSPPPAQSTLEPGHAANSRFRGSRSWRSSAIPTARVVSV